MHWIGTLVTSREDIKVLNNTMCDRERGIGEGGREGKRERERERERERKRERERERERERKETEGSRKQRTLQCKSTKTVIL